MKIALVFGKKGNDIKPKILQVRDNLVIDCFNSIDDMISNSRQRNYLFDRIVILSTVIRLTDNYEGELRKTWDYWRSCSPQTNIVCLCNSGKDDDIASYFTDMFNSPLCTSMSVDASTINLLCEASSDSIQVLNSKYGIKFNTDVEVENDVMVLPESNEPKPLTKEELKALEAKRKEERHEARRKAREEKGGLFGGLFGGKKKKITSNMTLEQKQPQSGVHQEPESQVQENYSNFDDEDWEEQYEDNLKDAVLSDESFDIDSTEDSFVGDNNYVVEELPEEFLDEQIDYVEETKISDVDSSLSSPVDSGSSGFDFSEEFGKEESFVEDTTVESSDSFTDDEFGYTSDDVYTESDLDNTESSINDATCSDTVNNSLFDSTTTGGTDYGVVNDDLEAQGDNVNTNQFDVSSDMSVFEDTIDEDSVITEDVADEDSMIVENTQEDDVVSTSDVCATQQVPSESEEFTSYTSDNYEDYSVEPVVKDMNNQSHQVELEEVDDDLGDITVPQKEIAKKVKNTAVPEEVQEVDTDLGNLGVGAMDASYRDKVEAPKVVEKVIEKVVEKEVIRGGVLDNIYSGKTTKIILVTGDRGSGVTTTALDIAMKFAQRTDVLYFDADTELHGLLSYIDYDSFRNYEASQQQGVKLCKSSRAFNNCVLRYSNNLDILTTNYGVVVSDEELELAQSVVAEVSHNYSVVVVDIPLDKIGCLTDLILQGNVTVCVEASKRGFMNLLCKLEDSELPMRYKRSIAGKGTLVATKLHPKLDMKKLYKYINGIVEFDINWLEMPIIPREAEITDKFLAEIIEG